MLGSLTVNFWKLAVLVGSASAVCTSVPEELKALRNAASEAGTLPTQPEMHVCMTSILTLVCTDEKLARTPSWGQRPEVETSLSSDFFLVLR
jgi:hypothetical protein